MTYCIRSVLEGEVLDLLDVDVVVELDEVPSLLLLAVTAGAAEARGRGGRAGGLGLGQGAAGAHHRAGVTAACGPWARIRLHLPPRNTHTLLHTHRATPGKGTRNPLSPALMPPLVPVHCPLHKSFVHF